MSIDAVMNRTSAKTWRAPWDVCAAVFVVATLGAVAPQPVGATAMALDDAIGTVAEAIAEKIDGRGLTLAVPDIPTLGGHTTVLGRYVAEELVIALYRRGISVVERSLLDRAMSELRLGLTDLMSVTAVKRFGRLVGARAILVGTLTDIGESVRLNVRIVAVETGQVVGAASGSLPRDPQTTAMLGQPVTPRRVLPKGANRRDEPDRNVSPGGVFWNEDFSRYDDGDPLPAWGPSVVVRRYPSGRSYLGSLKPGVHSVRQALQFTSNFSFEFDLAMDGTSRIEFALVLVDEKGDELRVDCVYSTWHGTFTVTLPGVNPQTVDASNIATLKLAKIGTTYKFYVSGRFVTTGVYTDYGRFAAFKLSVPPGAIFTGFLALRLP
jgi:TolB-like protein